MLKVMFFPNGNTMVFRDGQQVPDLQESWFMLYARFLYSHGAGPEEAEFTMPDGRKATVFETESGWNWQIGQ